VKSRGQPHPIISSLLRVRGFLMCKSVKADGTVAIPAGRMHSVPMILRWLGAFVWVLFASVALCGLLVAKLMSRGDVRMPLSGRSILWGTIIVALLAVAAMLATVSVILRQRTPFS
jgi:hypothetical protein